MGTHLGAVGLGGDATKLPEYLHQLLGVAALVGQTGADVRVYRWVDPSGSSASVTIEGTRVTCFTPGLVPGRTVRATASMLLADDCPYERPLEIEAVLGDQEIPLAITIDDLAISEPDLAPATTVELEIGCLAEQISVFPDEAAYRASGTPMAVESMIPSGMFAPDVLPGSGDHRPSSRMLMSGVVTTADVREHTLFGHPFVVVAVRSMGGEWRTAIDPADLADGAPPAVGTIMSGSFWLSGHVKA